MALDKLHDNVSVLFGFAVIVDTDDVAVGQPAGGLRFVLEPGERVERLGIVGVEQAHCLDGNAAADSRVPAIIDRAHRAAAQYPRI